MLHSNWEQFSFQPVLHGARATQSHSFHPLTIHSCVHLQHIHIQLTIRTTGTCTAFTFEKYFLPQQLYIKLFIPLVHSSRDDIRFDQYWLYWFVSFPYYCPHFCVDYFTECSKLYVGSCYCGFFLLLNSTKLKKFPLVFTSCLMGGGGGGGGGGE